MRASLPSCSRRRGRVWARPPVIWRRRRCGRSATTGTVWISTYTKNLQRQIAQELARVYPDEAERAEKVTVRKGRENYVCLLNFEEATGRLPVLVERETVALGLVARWLTATKNGDLQGGDFPAWAWPHPGFAERAHRPARRVHLCGVSALSALLLGARRAQDAGEPRGRRQSRADDGGGRAAIRRCSIPMPTSAARRRCAMCSTKGITSSMRPTVSSPFTSRVGKARSLRRWLRGAEGRSARRGRGLVERLTPVLENEPQELERVHEIAQIGAGAAGRWVAVAGRATKRRAERWRSSLLAVRAQVRARSEDTSSPYGLECEVVPATELLLAAAARVAAGVEGVGRAAERDCAGACAGCCARTAASSWRSIACARRRRCAGSSGGRSLQLPNWILALGAVGETPPGGYVDWLGVERFDGHDTDIGFYRHAIDPTVPFAAEVLEPSHGAFITSATLRDRPPEGGGGGRRLAGGGDPHGRGASGDAAGARGVCLAVRLRPADAGAGRARSQSRSPI